MQPSAPFLELDHVSKNFGAVTALRDVCLTLHSGEVHVLAGENGAGKSTLIRILSGALSGYSGQVKLDQQTVRFRNPRDAQNAGIATIHQELSLVPTLTIAENLALSKPSKAWSWVSRRAELKQAQIWLNALDLTLDPTQRVEHLPLALQQLVEIARALAHEARLFIMDEPTSALTEPEVEQLFARIVRLRAQGASILYISHRIQDIYRLADRITVLRDGAVAHTALAQELSQEQLLLAVGGHSRAPAVKQAIPAPSEPNLVLDELTIRGPTFSHPLLLDKVSMRVNPGEIVGVAGLLGSGAAELLQGTFGVLPSEGHVRLCGVEIPRGDPFHATHAGLMYLAGHRKLSVFEHMSIGHNTTLSCLHHFARWGHISHSLEQRTAQHMVDRLRIKAPSIHTLAGSLSGGNQQKVALARILTTQPHVLLLEEPTRGVDIRSREEIHSLLGALASGGLSILITSSDLEELVVLCHRILVLSAGRTVCELAGGECTRERILAAAMGGVL